MQYVAHEYMHVVWNRVLNRDPKMEDQKKAIERDINLVYNQHKTHFDEQLKQYNTYFSDPNRGVSVGTRQFYSEMHSILATEVDDAILPEGLRAWYVRWLPNRQVLPKTFRG